MWRWQLLVAGAAHGAVHPDRRARSWLRIARSWSKAPGCRSLFGGAHRAGDDTLAARHRHPDAEDAAHRGAARYRWSHSLEKKPPHVVPGTAVFLTSDPDFAPTALLHNLKHNKVLHEHNVILTIILRRYAARADERTGDDRRRSSEPFSAASSLQFGFMESRTCRRRWRSRASSAGPSTSCRRRSSCRGARSRPAAHSGMPQLAGPAVHRAARKSATDATDYFQIPTGRVWRSGTQVTI